MKAPRSLGSRRNRACCSKPEHFPLGPQATRVAAASVAAASVFLLHIELQKSREFYAEGNLTSRSIPQFVTDKEAEGCNDFPKDTW